VSPRETANAASDDATPPPGQWTDFFLAEVADREATIAALRNEVSRRDAVLDWLAENHPKALDLCPWKIASEVYRA
jgi:hypothetical protein